MSSEVRWSGRISNPLMGWGVTALVGVLTCVTLFANQFARPEKQMQPGEVPYFVGLMALVMLVVWSVSTLKVEVRADGFFITFGYLGWPKQKINWQNVAKVQAILVRPTEWGGWGYRWVPWKKATAAVLRKGEGLRFDFANGKVFVITIDGANEALEAIRSVLDELPPENL